MDDKIIISNRSALSAKYTPAGIAKIKASIDALIAADKARGIATRFVYVNDAATMKRYGGKAVSTAKDPSQNKAAVDAIFKSANPAYLILLGAIDVIPHQDLSNPLYTKDDDDDKYAWGDLPYACDAAYSRE